MHTLRFYLTWEQKSDFNIVFFFWGVEAGGLATYSCQVNSSHFRVFSTGSDHEKGLFTGFEIFHPVINTVKV